MEILWKPDRAAKETLHEQVLEYFTTRIAAGDWPMGMRMPSERQLATQFGINRSTVTHILDELKALGVLRSEGTRGTFVANNTWSLMNQPNWNQHINESLYMPNQRVIQKINHFEFQEGIIRLGTGELSPSLFPKDIMTQMLVSASGRLNSLSYEEGLGQYPLRELIAQYLLGFGIKVTPEQVLITSGSLQSLHLLSIGLLQRGSTVYIETPSYLKSLFTFQSAGMKLQGVPMTPTGLDVKALKSQFKNKETNLLYTIPTFHNPTGTLMTEANRMALMDVITELQIPVIEDDAYRDLWLDEPPPAPLKSMDKNGNIIYLGTLSKVFAPGIRLGWVVGPQAVVERLGDIKMQIDYGTSSLSQLVAQEWFRAGYHQTYREALRAALTRRRDIMIGAIHAYLGKVGCFDVPKGSFYIWFKLNRKINMIKLFEEALKQNVLLNIGSIYDFTENNAIRLSYAYASESDLVKGIEILSKIIPTC